MQNFSLRVFPGWRAGRTEAEEEREPHGLKRRYRPKSNTYFRGRFLPCQGLPGWSMDLRLLRPRIAICEDTWLGFRLKRLTISATVAPSKYAFSMGRHSIFVFPIFFIITELYESNWMETIKSSPYPLDAVPGCHNPPCDPPPGTTACGGVQRAVKARHGTTRFPDSLPDLTITANRLGRVQAAPVPPFPWRLDDDLGPQVVPTIGDL